MEEKNLLVWINSSRYNNGIGFSSLVNGDCSEELDAIKRFKSKRALISLLKREYIDLIKTDKAITILNEAATRAGTISYPEIKNARDNMIKKINIPWSYGSEIFQITAAGRFALTSFTSKLNKSRIQQENLAKIPRFVISARLDGNNYNVGGAAVAYRVVKETSGKVYVKEVEPNDGFPKMHWRDNAFKTENQNSYGDDRVNYLSKANVLLMDAIPEDYIALRSATVAYDNEINQAMKIKEQEILPIEKKFASSKKEAWQNLNTLILSKTSEKSKHISTTVDLQAEEGFILSLDEEDHFKM